MTQASFDFGVFATAQCNHARRLNAPPAPDQDGLFDIAGVVEICGRRQCHVEPRGELFADVQFREKKISLTAIAPGRWDPVAILSACTQARGGRVYGVDDNVIATNPGGIDELRIARVVGADGLRPYLSKQGKHGVGKYNDGKEKILSPTYQRFSEFFVEVTAQHRDIPLGIGLIGFARAVRGDPTWAFRALMIGFLDRDFRGSRAYCSDYNVRRALRALEDAGLIAIELGPRGGMATAKVEWLPRAYLAPERLAPADEEALGELA